MTDPCHEAAALLLMQLLVRERRPSEALTVYQEQVSALAADLDLQPSAPVRIFAGRLYETLAAVPAERSGPAGNLPMPLTSFVGGEWEQEEVRRTMLSGVGGSRLVTLVGTGGAGKTRLTLEVARGIALKYPDGAWLVELGAVRDEALVPHTVARVLGLSEGTVRTVLHATISWSYALLEHPARALLRRLSVFADGWALEAAEAVCAGEGLAPEDVPTLLGVLVDSSMVQVVRPTDEVRYRLLESIRAFAALELASTLLQGRSEAEFAHEQLCGWCLQVVRASIADVRVGSRQSI